MKLIGLNINCILRCVCITLLLVQPLISHAQTAGVLVIPKPQQAILGAGVFTLTDTSNIIVQANSLEEGTKLANFLKKATGYSFPVITTVLTESSGDIALSILPSTNTTIGEEGYLLTVKPNQITIQANTSTGLFYGWQTLRQLLPNKIEASQVVKSVNWVIPVVSITDAPRFKWRGFLQDDSRHFFGVEATKKLLDLMAMIKLNKFHWHLVDDHGWRIEIKSRPKLQTIASVNANCSGRNSGYYTQTQITEIVNYAAALHIEVIPEIEMPGHSVEVLAAYPELSCTKLNAAYGGPFSVQCAVGASSDLLCAGKEATFTFISDVISEIAPLFPGGYIHLGGDETKDFSRWTQCKDCSKRKTAANISTDLQLKNYFMTRAAGIVANQNKQWIGWSGVETNSIPPANGILQYWEPEASTTASAYTTARAGYNMILSPYDLVYFDMRWVDGELGDTWGPAIDLSTAYNYEPMPSGLTTLQQSKILGVEACIWSDKITNENDKEFLVAPRIFTTAEIDWAAPGKDYNNFLARVYPKYERLDSLHFKYRKPDPGIGLMITSQANTNIKVDSLYTYTFSGYDTGNLTVTFSAPILPSWLIFNPVTGILTGIPTINNQGPNNVTLRISNGISELDQSFTITVGSIGNGTGLLRNADLESIGGWDLWGGGNSTTCAQSGNNGIAFKDGEAGAEQIVTGLLPNTAYVFSGYVNSNNTTIQMGVKNFGNSTIQTNCKSTTFKQFQVGFTTGSVATSATVFVYRASGTAQVCADDFDLLPLLINSVTNPKNAAPTCNISPNPGIDYIQLDFNLTNTSTINLNLYDLMGAKINSIVQNKMVTMGHYQEVMPRNNLPSGTYLLHIQVNDTSMVKKIMFL
jgi:N-acetyl-beta-hexosaminidase